MSLAFHPVPTEFVTKKWIFPQECAERVGTMICTLGPSGFSWMWKSFSPADTRYVQTLINDFILQLRGENRPLHSASELRDFIISRAGKMDGILVSKQLNAFALYTETRSYVFVMMIRLGDPVHIVSIHAFSKKLMSCHDVMGWEVVPDQKTILFI